MSRAATITAAVVDTIDVQVLAASVGRVLIGFSVAETAGSTASVVLRHGVADTADVIAWVRLAANGVHNVVFGDGGIAVDGGVFVELVSGDVGVSLWHKAG